jgi:oxalate decarboxylase/phosphoglucose isomerase-like protein (cupin superfamily)
MFDIYNATIIELPKIHNKAGNITAINDGDGSIPFKIKRVYYLYDVPGGEGRGAHAHKNLHQLIIAASGSFEITLSDGKINRTFHLTRPNYGLFVPPGLWRILSNFSSGAICLALVSDIFDPKDYIRDYNEFLVYKQHEIRTKYKGN